MADQDRLRRIVALVTSESSHRRDHLCKEPALPLQESVDIQIEISGFIRWHADRVALVGYFRGRNARSRSMARMNPLSVSV